jgi:hypothetical protein
MTRRLEAGRSVLPDADYRVVGVRRDQSRFIVGTALSLAHAEKLKQMLLDSGAYPYVEIELDGDSKSDLDLTP